MSDPSPGARHHDAQDVDEFMGELRVALPGAQVLFGFLLTVPFSSRFEALPSFDRQLYFVALAFAAAASVLLISPSVLRQFMRDARREELLEPGSIAASAGLACLALSLMAALLLVAAQMFSNGVAAAIGVASLSFTVAAWIVFPLLVRHRHRR